MPGLETPALSFSALYCRCLLPSWQRLAAGAGRRNRACWLAAWGLGLLLSLGWARPVVAQVAPTTPWVADSVLSTLAVRALVADEQGYLWVATRGGVRRYDGYQAVPLAQLLPAAAHVAAPRGYVNALVRDADGRLWIGSVDGLYCWAAGTLTRRALPLGPANGTEAEAVYALWLDPRTHRLWIGYSSGRILVLDPAHPATQAPLLPLLREQPSSFTAAPGGEVWLTTFNGQLHRLSAQGQRRRVYQQPGAYLVPVPGTRYALSSQALYELDEATGALRQRLRWLPASDLEQKYFYPALDSLGRPTQWLAQQRRLVLHWGAPGTLPQVQQAPVAFTATEPSTQYSLFADARRLWWAFSPEAPGCYKGGTAVPVQPLPVAGQVRPPSVRGLAGLPDGRFLLTTYNGVFVQPAGQPQATLRNLFLTRAGRPWPAMLYDVEVSAAGRVLFADEANTFGELNPQTGALTYYPLQPGPTDAAPLNGRVVYRTRAGAVWGGATNGLYQLEEAQQRVRRYRTPAGIEPLRGQLVRSISEDATGTLWLATEHGLCALNPTTGAVQHYGTAEPAPTRHLPTDDILCVYAQPGGAVWLGTSTQGILQLVPGQGMVRQVGPAQGLPSPIVATLLPGAAGELWAGTYAGLVRYRPATGQLTIYGAAEGLPNPELNKQAAYRAPDGTLYFGGVSGAFRVVRDATLGSPDQPPRLLLTARAGGAGAGALQFLAAPRGVPATLQLGESLQEGGFELALNDYRAPALNRFFYQLRPVDAPPDSAGRVQPTGRHLRLHGLDAGTYQLTVWGQTPAGQRTPPQRLRVGVARPWWQHPLALLGAVGLLLGAGLGVQQVRIRRLQREAQLRTRIAADLHDEVGALLTRVNLRAELLQEPAAPDELTADMQALLLDSRAALLMMRDVVWSIDAGADTVGALRDRLHDYLEATTQASGLRATFTVRHLPDEAPLAPQLRQHLYLIAKEAITNTLRHAPAATRLTLMLARQGPTLELSVCDDGPPHPSAALGGMGQRNMQRRAEALGGQCRSGPAPDGWAVRVQVPYKNG